jgi:hypothetical protein
VPIVQRAGWAQGWYVLVWRIENLLSPLGLEPQNVWAVVGCCTDCAVPAYNMDHAKQKRNVNMTLKFTPATRGSQK